MLLEQSQLNWIRNWDVVGLRGTGSDSYTLDRVFVPEAYTVRRDLDASGGSMSRFSASPPPAPIPPASPPSRWVSPAPCWTS